MENITATAKTLTKRDGTFKARKITVLRDGAFYTERTSPRPYAYAIAISYAGDDEPAIVYSSKPAMVGSTKERGTVVACATITDEA